MTAQPKLFDDIGQIPISQPTQSPQEAKREAIERVTRAANEEWMAAAGAIVEKLARGRQSFTTDDVWGELDALTVSTPEPRAMGAVMTIAKRDGIVKASGGFVSSRRAICHGRPIQIWLSLTYGGSL
jgi:hypothetical protein